MPDRADPAWPAQLELGIAERPLPGEARSGDRAVLAGFEGGALVAAIDGLGHGAAAADAAAVAAEVLAERRGEEPATLIEACHAALRSTRGVVMTLAWIDLDGGRLSWTGVGDVEGRLVHAAAGPRAPTEGALTKGGVVGYNLPSVRVTSAALAAGDVLVLATDGVGSGFGETLAAGGAPADRRPDPGGARQAGRRRPGRRGAYRPGV